MEGPTWRMRAAAWLDCAVVGIHLGILFGVTPFLWWTAYRDGAMPNASNDFRITGLWNHDQLRETMVDFLLYSATLAAIASLASVLLNPSRVRGRWFAAVSCVLLCLYSAFYVSLID